MINSEIESSMSNIKITVFTPCYNRAYILPELYKSLLAQDCHDFEWIIVDDGSTDDTEKLVKKWLKSNRAFPIIYKKVKNGGKHRAINIGVKLARSPLFFIIDSDDQAVEGAITTIIEYEKELPSNKHIAGLSGTRISPTGKTIGENGNISPGDYIDASNLERKKKSLLGDKAEVYYTKILKKYPFPEFKGENFLDEGIIWNRIAQDDYKLRWFNTPFIICAYREDGLTKNLDEKNRKNPNGFALYIREKAKQTKSPFKRLRYYYSYYAITREDQTETIIGSALRISKATLFILKLIAKIKF